MTRKLLVSVLVLFLVLSVVSGCQNKEPVRIGLQGPLTGEYAYEGKGFQNAVQMLVDQTNQAGGLLGRQIELIVEDDAGDPTQAALAAQAQAENV